MAKNLPAQALNVGDIALAVLSQNYSLASAPTPTQVHTTQRALTPELFV